MKKIIYIISLFSIILLSIYIKDINGFTIEDPISHIENGIEDFISRGESEQKDIELRKILNLQNEKIVLFEYKNGIGSTFLVRGINGKYKVESTGYGSGGYRSYIHKVKRQKYLLIFYKDLDLRVNQIKAIVENKEYDFKGTNEIFNILYVPVNTSIGDGSRNFEIIFLDKDNKNITREIYSFHETVR